MDRFFAYARILTTGAPLPSAIITVYDAGTNNLAVIFDDNLDIPTPKANPFIAASDGFFFFYAGVGRYDVRIAGGSVAHAAYTWGDVVLGEGHGRSHVLATSTALGPDHSTSGLTAGHVLTALSPTTAAFQVLPAGMTPDHGTLTGLGDDDHPRYPNLTGRAGGQDLAGGNAANEDLTLRGTSHTTPGDLLLNPDGGSVGIGRVPGAVLDVQGGVRSRSLGFTFPDGTTQITAAGAGTPVAWSIVGDNIHNVNIGNVGIGITAPTRKLDVRTGVTGPLVLHQTNPALGASIEMLVAGVRRGLVAGTPTGLRLTSGSGSTAHLGLFATSDGKVGVNTLDPVKSGLQVVGEQSDDPLRVTADVGFKPGVELYEDSSPRGSLRASSQRIGIFNRFDQGISVDGSGRSGVGLGEEVPKASLHIRGTVGTLGRDSVHLLVETSEVSFPTRAELWGKLGRVGLIEGKEVDVTPGAYFRIADGGDLGTVLIDPSNGFVAVGYDKDKLPLRRLSAFSRQAEPLQVYLETEVGGASGIDFHESSTRRARIRSTSTAVEIENQSGVVFTITQATSRVGIGVAAPTEVLDVAGNVHAASFPTSSDERFKKNVQSLGACLDKVRSLRGVTYEWNDFYRYDLRRGEASDGEQIGFIAQEVEKIFPRLVRPWSGHAQGEDSPGGRFRALEYQRMVPVLVEAIKELADRLEVLEGVIVEPTL